MDNIYICTTIECTTYQSGLSDEARLWVILMCPSVGLSTVRNVPLWLGALLSQEKPICGGGGEVYGKPRSFSLHFDISTLNVLKHKVCLFKNSLIIKERSCTLRELKVAEEKKTL